MSSLSIKLEIMLVAAQASRLETVSSCEPATWFWELGSNPGAGVVSGLWFCFPACAVIHKQPSSAVVSPLPGWEACGGGRPGELRINVTAVMRGISHGIQCHDPANEGPDTLNSLKEWGHHPWPLDSFRVLACI